MNIKTRENDARVFVPEWENKFDRIICDLPCSGTGIIRKKPDIRFKSEESLEQLPELQIEILNNAARYLKPGGRMLYSTCTWRTEENEDVVERFIMGNRGFDLTGFDNPFTGETENAGMMTLLPGKYGTDGFFICLMRKKDV